MISRLVTSVVTVKRLSDTEIDRYIASGDWQGKAGGYAIQGPAATFVQQIAGSYSNIVGLSLFDVAAILTGNGLMPD
jgi:septum formation protein